MAGPRDSESWDDIAGWWIDAVRDDPSQSEATHRVLHDLVEGTAGVTLDLGCGEGQGMRLAGGTVIGVDLSLRLLASAHSLGPAVCGRLPHLGFVRSNAVDRVISVGLLDLVAEHRVFFAENSRVVRAGGHLVVVINHPVATSPHSEPLADPTGEVLWRWGDYLVEGVMLQRVEDRTINLFHRPLGLLLTSAAGHGWILEEMIEAGPSQPTLERHPELRGQEQIPSVLGIRWRRAQ